jgi:hypothetical protein
MSGYKLFCWSSICQVPRQFLKEAFRCVYTEINKMNNYCDVTHNGVVVYFSISTTEGSP